MFIIKFGEDFFHQNQDCITGDEQQAKQYETREEAETILGEIIRWSPHLADTLPKVVEL